MLVDRTDSMPDVNIIFTLKHYTPINDAPFVEVNATTVTMPTSYHGNYNPDYWYTFYHALRKEYNNGESWEIEKDTFHVHDNHKNICYTEEDIRHGRIPG